MPDEHRMNGMFTPVNREELLARSRIARLSRQNPAFALRKLRKRRAAHASTRLYRRV
jgi:hypothetical protein